MYVYTTNKLQSHSNYPRNDMTDFYYPGMNPGLVPRML